MKSFHASAIARVLVLAIAACGDEDSPLPLDAADADADAADTDADAADTDAEAASSSSTPAASAELDWRDCGQFEDRNMECAEVEVPVDYEQPDGETLALAVRRILANPLEPYHGALLFNPGGPGGEGIDTALAIFQQGVFNVIAPGYDIIGFDPRGVANSGETGCGIVPAEMYPGAMQLGTAAAGVADYVADYRADGERCERAWGPLFRKLGSNNVVRDMEEIRKALNEPVLNFIGASYGTLLGALYAHAYPETTGRMVLDAAVQPRASNVRAMRSKFSQIVALHEQILSECESGARPCPPNPRLVFDQALANARQRRLERSFVATWAESLMSTAGLQDVVTLLTAQATDPGGDWVTQVFGGANESSGSDVALFSVNCTDDNFEPPTLAELESLRSEFVEVSPVFAELFVEGAASCAGWPVTRDPVPMPTALDARPLLVIGGTSDGRTPYEWSQAMTEALGNATLLTSNHFGHVAIKEGGDCVKLTVRAYLASGSLPSSGSVCD